MANIEEQLIDVQTTLAHQESTIEDLNKTVTEQWQKIEFLEKTLKQITTQMFDLQDAMEPIEQTKPPHY